MSHWNYRVMLHPDLAGDEVYSAIHEVYYDGDKVTGWTQTPATPGGEDVRWVLERMAEALDKPVLNFKTGEEIEP
jgi:hypothetical protein